MFHVSKKNVNKNGFQSKIYCQITSIIIIMNKRDSKEI